MKKVVNERKYDPRNKLNDLSGSEWKFSTKTVISKAYPINMQHKLRSQHGGQKPPELCADLIKIFTKENMIVLDPFMGVGGTLLGASLCNRRAIGIDLNQKWIDIYNEVCKLENINSEQTYCGDSFVVLDCIENDSIDFILTDVPYWNIDTLKHTRSNNDSISKLGSFNNGTEDQSKEEWLQLMYDIIKKSLLKLKNNRYIAIFIGDIYKGKEYHMLSAELAFKLSTIKDIKLKSNIVWVDNSKSLHVFGYPSSYVPSLIHQNILIFKKEI